MSTRQRAGLALAVVALFATAVSHAAPGRTPGVGETFPALSSFQLEGELPDLSRAQVVIVDFWASWCSPCKASFPCYEQLQQEFGERGVVIIAVNVDREASAMAAFLARQRPTFSVVRDAEQMLVAAVAPPAMPTSFVLDAKGVVRAVHRGFHGEKTQRAYVEEITRLLEAQP